MENEETAVPAEAKPLNALAARIHANAVAKGFYDEGATTGFDGMLMNIVSEVEEAHRHWRNGKDLAQVWHSVNVRPGMFTFDRLEVDGDTYKVWLTRRQIHPQIFTKSEWHEHIRALGVVPEPEGIPVELCDVIIRALDTLAMIGVDIDAIVADKMDYNATREHRHGGKRS